jgi:predicted transcriptional regulator
MLQAQPVAKTPISLRLDDRLLEMLEKIQQTEGTKYWDRDRTWLIEHAIEQLYGPVYEKIRTQGGSNGAASES